MRTAKVRTTQGKEKIIGCLLNSISFHKDIWSNENMHHDREFIRVMEEFKLVPKW